MEFKSTKGIFLQIADTLSKQVLDGKLNAGDRVPSVRDLAVEVEVNRNTVMRSYSYLQEKGIFENRRGVGFFVADTALEIIKQEERQIFFQEILPEVIEKIELLNLNSSDLKLLLQTIKNNDNENQ